MKKLMTMLFGLLLALSLGAVAQNTDQNTDQNNTANPTANNTDQKTNKDEAKETKKVEKAEKKEAKAAEKGKTLRLTGWVKNENGKDVFVNDKDKESWDISNPDAVQGHEGHHVKVRAKLDESNHSMTIAKVSMMRKGKQAKEVQQQEK